MQIIGDLLKTLQEWSQYPRNIKHYVNKDKQNNRYTLWIPEFYWYVYHLAYNSQVHQLSTSDEVYKLDIHAYETYDSYQAVWWLLVLNNINWLYDYNEPLTIFLPKPETISQVLDNKIHAEEENPIQPVNIDVEVF